MSPNHIFILGANQTHLNTVICWRVCPTGVSVQVWSKLTKWFRRQSADKVHFDSLYSVVTLKIRSRSPKSNQIFKPPKVTIHKVWPESVIWFKR